MAVDIEEAQRIFQELYTNIDGRSLSLKGREDHQFSSKSFVYGEVVPSSFLQMMKEVEPEPGGGVFYDLGSGTGKGVLLAHLLLDFRKTIGIELLEPLFTASIEVMERYQTEFRPAVEEKVKDKEIVLRPGSFLDADLRDADFVFMNSTCFQDDLMEALEVKLECLRPHAGIISLSKPLRSPAYHQYKHKLFDFSWGQATAFYHRKRLWKVYM